MMLIAVVLGAVICASNAPLKPISETLLNHLKFAAKISILPYCSERKVEKKNLIVLNDNTTMYLENLTIGKRDDVAFVTGFDSASNQIIVAYRGSYNMDNWLRNIQMILKDVDAPWALGTDIKLHRAWYYDAKLSLPKLQAQLLPLIAAHPDSDLLISGHSSGAALGTIAAFLALNKGGILYGKIDISRVKVVTIGGPRIGNAAFVHVFDKMGWHSVYRAVRNGDPGPFWPPKTFGFKHHGLREVYIPKKQEIAVFCDEQAFSRAEGSCLNRESFLEVHDNPYRANDHHLHYFGIQLATRNCDATIIPVT